MTCILCSINHLTIHPIFSSRYEVLGHTNLQLHIWMCHISWYPYPYIYVTISIRIHIWRCHVSTYRGSFVARPRSTGSNMPIKHLLDAKGSWKQNPSKDSWHEFHICDMTPQTLRINFFTNSFFPKLLCSRHTQIDFAQEVLMRWQVTIIQ